MHVASVHQANRIRKSTSHGSERILTHNEHVIENYQKLREKNTSSNISFASARTNLIESHKLQHWKLFSKENQKIKRANRGKLNAHIH